MTDPPTPDWEIAGKNLAEAIQHYWQDSGDQTSDALLVRWICVAELFDPADDVGFSVCISGTPSQIGGCTYAELLGMLSWAITIEKAKITSNYFLGPGFNDGEPPEEDNDADDS